MGLAVRYAPIVDAAQRAAWWGAMRTLHRLMVDSAQYQAMCAPSQDLPQTKTVSGEGRMDGAQAGGVCALESA